jgi:hypothetical protein
MRKGVDSDDADFIQFKGGREMNRIGSIKAELLFVLALQVLVGCGGGNGGNQPPAVSITRPQDGASYPYGEPIGFVGSATDPEDGTLTGDNLVWTASPGGEIGTGRSCTCNDLSVGLHRIRLTATDSQGASGYDSIVIEITPGNWPPTVTITGPLDGASFVVGTTIIFGGGATDPEEGLLTGDSLVWTASPDWIIGTGELIMYSNLLIGTYTITLTATDAEGGSGSASVEIHVTPPNLPPEVGIESPPDGSSFYATCPIDFVGSAVDPEEGALTGDSLIWSSSIDAHLGNGEALMRDDLSEGAHDIRLFARDSAGGTGYEYSAIDVQRTFLHILSIDPAAFPTIESTLLVNTASGRNCHLTEDNFAVDEDDVPQVIDSVICGATDRMVADIVVVFDDSGSMSDDIAEMQAQATSFANEILGAGVDAWFGLITTVNWPEIDLQLTADVWAFQAAVDRLTASGGTEPSLEGVMLGLNQMQWRPEALKVFLVITDELSNGDTYTMEEVIRAVNAAGGTVFSVSEDYRASGVAPFDKEGTTHLKQGDITEHDVRVLAEETGGIWLNIHEADFSLIVDEIVNWFMSLYRVVYTTSNQIVDYVVRYTRIIVADPLEGVGGDCHTYQALQ